MDFLGVAALLPGNGSQESNDVFGNVVLYSGAITDGIDVTEGCTYNTEMGVGLEGVLVVLSVEAIRQSFTDLGTGYDSRLVSPSRIQHLGILTDSSGPQAESGWDLLDNLLSVLHLAEKNAVRLDLLHASTSQNLDAITSETTLS